MKKLWLLKKITNYWHLNFLLLIAPKRGWHLCISFKNRSSARMPTSDWLVKVSDAPLGVRHFFSITSQIILYGVGWPTSRVKVPYTCLRLENTLVCLLYLSQLSSPFNTKLISFHCPLKWKLFSSWYSWKKLFTWP